MPQDQFGNGQSEMGADKGTQICRDGGKERISGGQNRHQDTQQDDGSRSAEQNRPADAGTGRRSFRWGSGRQRRRPAAEQIAQQQAKAFPEHQLGRNQGSAAAPESPMAWTGQQHQQRQQVPQPEIPV